MYKLCLNTRDELLIIDLSKIAYFQANGNYTALQYIGGIKQLITIGISKVEEAIRITWPRETPSPFVRLGRSLIINQSFLTGISLAKQKITLSDFDKNSCSVTVPKPVLKEYKMRIHYFYLRRQEKASGEKNAETKAVDNA